MASNPASYGKQAVTRGTIDSRNDEAAVDADELLDLLGDSYAREVLAAVTEQPRSGREVSEVTSVSKPTAFRRLNRLEDAGLVRTDLVLDSDGHHHKQYRAVVEEVSVGFGPDGIFVAVEVEHAGTDVVSPKYTLTND